MLVDGMHSGTPIRDQYDGLSSLDGLDDLLPHLAVERSLGHVADPPRIYEQEVPSSPFRIGELPVARHPAAARPRWRCVRPRIRLNSVDLPTLGRPTIATVGRPTAPAACPSRAPMGISSARANPASDPTETGRQERDPGHSEHFG